MSTGNIANAILILGALYLHLQYGLDELYTLLLVLWGIATWILPSFRKERKQLIINVNKNLEELVELQETLREYLKKGR